MQSFTEDFFLILLNSWFFVCLKGDGILSSNEAIYYEMYFYAFLPYFWTC